jgi:hypothetical protein
VAPLTDTRDDTNARSRAEPFEIAPLLDGILLAETLGQGEQQ